MSVFELALETVQGRQDAGDSLAEEFASLGQLPPAPSGPAPCCRCGAASSLDKAYLTDPLLADTNACSYAMFQGMPPPADFWSAVVAGRCSAVVVLGHDTAHVKSFFPQGPLEGIQLPEGRQLRCVHHVSFPDEGLAVRQLEVAGPSGAGEMWVNFFHLLSWPDAGVPSTAAGMLRLCRELESCRRPGARIAVQCCCGTDAALGSCPAGAFISIDMLRQRLQRLQLAHLGTVQPEQVRDAIDVARLVRALRAQRRGLVETPAQYAFIHSALADEISEALRTERRLMPRGIMRSALAATPGAPTLSRAPVAAAE